MILSKQVYSFLRIVECGSISRAAEQMYVSTPALAQQLRLLEEEVGTPLLLRSHSGVTPTEAGAVFYKEMLHITAQVDRLQQQMQSIAKQQDAALVIAYRQSFDQTLLYESFTRYQQRYGRPLITYPCLIEQTLQHVAEKRADACITSLSRNARASGLQLIPILALDPWLSVPAGHPLAKKDVIEPEDLADVELVLPHEGQYENADALTEQLTQLGVPYRVARVNGSIESDLYCIRHNACRLTVLPSPTRELINKPFHANARYTICFAYPPALEARVRDFANILVACGKKRAAELNLAPVDEI